MRRSRPEAIAAIMKLETRVLMAAGSLGVDIGSSLGYVDLMQEAPAFQPINATSLATDANGWPLADAKVNVIDELVNQPYNGPDATAQAPDIGGTYHLSFQGRATLGADFYGNFTVQNQVYNAKTNTTTADLIVAHNTIAYLTIDFQNTYNPASKTGAGVANVKLIQPGYAADTSQVFTTDMLTALKPFSTIRYLNLDGANAIGPIYNGAYQAYATPSFTVGSGTHTVTFQGLNNTGDNTAFIDSVAIVPDATISPTVTTAPTGPLTVLDPSFESDQLPANGYAYNATGTPWTFAGSSGLAANQSAFTSSNPNAPDGNQVAFLQNVGTFTQNLASGTAGSYHITFDSMQRSNFQNAAQSFNVLVDGKVVATFSPPIDRLTTLDWSQRKLPSAASQASGPGATGESWEDMIALANASGTDLWINIPGNATNDYITQLATLIKQGDTVNGVTYAGLLPNLKVDLEFSNEVWGGIYNNFLYDYDAAQTSLNTGNTTLNNDGTTDGYAISQRYYLEQTMNATTIFRSVLGADPTFAKIRPMLGSGENNPGYFSSVLPWFESTYGAPSQYFYGIGGANYANATDFSSVDNLIASLYADLPAQASTVAAYTTIADYYGLHNVAYEGGPYTAGAPTAAGGQVALAAARDPRMEDFVRQLYATWYAAGGDVADVYDGPSGVYSPNNQYAILEQAQLGNPTASAKFRGLLDLSQAAPVPVTAGNPVGLSSVTSLSVASDSTGQGFASPTAGQTNYWLLNVATAGTYDVVLQAGSGSSAGKATVGLQDQVVPATAILPGATSVLARLTLHAGLNTLTITTTSPFNVASLTVMPEAPYLGDLGFETDRVGTSLTSYVYNPQGTPWAFSSQSGITANGTLFTSGNSAAPDGNQVAFIQNTGSISQPASIFLAGTYRLTFAAAQRQNFGTSQTLQVLIDGKVVGTYTPVGYAYQSFSTPSVTLAAGSHLITFRGMNSTGDGTAFLDGVSLVAGPAVPILGDPSFETVREGSYAFSFDYNPTLSPWTFSNRSGISANNTYFTNGNPPAPDGTQVAFIQNSGTISQPVTFYTAGTYAISLSAAQRGNWKSIAQTVQVQIDGKSVGTFTPSGAAYQSFSTLGVSLTAGSHIISFVGMNPTDDATAFLDSVAINPVPTTTTTDSPELTASPILAPGAAVPVPLVVAAPAAPPAVTVAAVTVKKPRRLGFPAMS